MRTVSIVNQCVTDYRVPLWNGLRAALAEHDVRLRLLHGRAHHSFAQRNDTVKLDWSEELPMRELHVAGKELVYLEVGDVMAASDMVITNQEVRLLHNFRLLGQHFLGRGRVALMGSGRDRTKLGRPSVAEGVKTWMSRRVHWWFAYNECTAREVAGYGFPANRITTFMNSTDTHSLRASASRTTTADLDALRQTLGIGLGPTAVYVGGIDRIKQIGYLIDSVRHVRAALPTFELLIIGAGADREALKAATAADSWIHWVPPQFGETKVRHMLLAQVCLMPAWVGLGIVDTFALGVPLITTDRFPHSVEIDYLRHGVNGWCCAGSPDPAGFGNGVAQVLHNESLLRTLREGALRAGDDLSVESAVSRFTEGVLRALDAPPAP
jgi:glycosyltransferase involved in cell wall biosynthesis